MVAAAGIIGTVAAALPLAGKVLDAIDPLLDRFFPDPDKKAELRNALLGELAKFDVAQLEVNKAEAQTGSLYMAGWRPGFGWLGLGMIGYHGMVSPIIEALVSIRYPGFTMPQAPQFIMENVWAIIFGMLGMGALRQYDKMMGTDTKSVAMPRVSPTVDLGKSLKGVR